jgi:hypothetical protein
MTQVCFCNGKAGSVVYLPLNNFYMDQQQNANIKVKIRVVLLSQTPGVNA